MNNPPQAPEYWKFLERGEVIKRGDYFNVNSNYPDKPVKWMPYNQIIGQNFYGTMTSIRPTILYAPLPPNAAPLPDIVVKVDSKTRVQDYLKKLSKKA